MVENEYLIRKLRNIAMFNCEFVNERILNLKRQLRKDFGSVLTGKDGLLAIGEQATNFNVIYRIRTKTRKISEKHPICLNY